MARMPYLDLEKLPAEHQNLLARRANIYRALANSPEGLSAFSTLAGYIRYKSPVDPRLRELAILMVGYVAREPYEWSHHIELALKFGVTDADIRGLMDEANGRPSALEPIAKAVVAAAREMTQGISVTDTTFAALRSSLDNEHITDLILTIAFYCAVVRVLASLKIDVEDDYQRYLEQYPLPPQREGKSA